MPAAHRAGAAEYMQCKRYICIHHNKEAHIADTEIEKEFSNQKEGQFFYVFDCVLEVLKDAPAKAYFFLQHNVEKSSANLATKLVRISF